MQERSASESVPDSVTTPPRIHTESIRGGFGTRAAMLAGVRKIPDPMVTPMTMPIELHRPSRRSSWLSCFPPSMTQPPVLGVQCPCAQCPVVVTVSFFSGPQRFDVYAEGVEENSRGQSAFFARRPRSTSPNIDLRTL